MNLLFTMQTTSGQREKIASLLAGEEISYNAAPSDDEIALADVIVGNLPYKDVKKAKNLKLLQLNSAGANPYLTLEQDLPGAVLCCASGAYGKAISEHMLAMLLSLVKRLNQYRNDQLKAEWTDRGQVRSLTDMTVLVIGLGDIGGSFARLVHALGAKVLGVRRTAGEKPDYADGIYTTDRLDEALPKADVVALTLPETPGTVGILNAERIGKMKCGAYILNVGRGSAVDQDALLRAVREGKIAGAGLDVTTPEPLPAESPLWQEENVLITPHVSGHFHLQATHDRIVDIAIHNILALRDGGEFMSRVDAKKGY